MIYHIQKGGGADVPPPATLLWISLLFRSSDEIKVRVQYFKAIWIRFMSNVWLQAHFPQKTLWFGKKPAFLSQKSWFQAISRLISFPTILICKKWTKYKFTATAKFRRNRFIYSNTPKHAQNWLFLGIFLFFLFLRSIFWELWTQNLLLWDKISRMTDLCHKCTKNGTFKFD